MPEIKSTSIKPNTGKLNLDNLIKMMPEKIKFKLARQLCSNSTCAITQRRQLTIPQTPIHMSKLFTQRRIFLLSKNMPLGV